MPGQNELEHAYGDRVHLIDNPYLGTILARISAPGTPVREVVSLLRLAYELLLAEAVRELPSVERVQPTRMAEQHPEAGQLRAQVVDPDQRVVVCDVIRGGIVPSQVCFERLLAVLPDEALRLDHLNMARVSDEQGRVTGVDLSGSKIGGTVEGATLVVPDPMGATGSTLLRAVRHYREHHGRPARVLALPMIVTPEYLRAVLDEVDDVVVYAGRLDRGLSPPEVLAAPPGTHWDRERGLDDHSYIVPGAGGVGEVLNNSWC
jgi:uracil phosphoribosyltransferase